MAFTKIGTLSVQDQFVHQVQEMILSGEFAPGEMLPPARDLVTLTGVSRPVITAGLVALEKMGFVEVKPRIGTFVCDYRRTGTVETLNAIMRHNGKLRKHETESLMQIRTPPESLCVEMVIANASDEELQALAPIVDEIEKAAKQGQPEITAEHTFHFHHELAVLSGNMLLPLLYHSFKATAISLWTLFCRHRGCEKLYTNKRTLYCALLDRDRNAALKMVPGEYPQNYKEYDWPVD